MPEHRSQTIEHGILRMLLQSTDHLGHATDLGRLATFFRQTFSDIDNRELVEALKRLRPKYLTLCKYVQGQPSCLEYPTQMADDIEFFYRGDGFRLRRTPETYPRAEELAAIVTSSHTDEKPTGASVGLLFIADSRIEELRKLPSTTFDFQKLIRLCEELNSSYREGNFYATAMLTRGILDHVPPLFGHQTFTQVANNYAGGTRSFKETMQHLEGASRKVSDAVLHTPIRKSETLPTSQQVGCGQQLDVLLGEIVRIMK